MKKGLLSLLVVALTVVGCQDYDDQFDSLNKTIVALQADVTTMKGITTAITALDTQLKALEGKVLQDGDLADITSQIGVIQKAINDIPLPPDVSDIETQVTGLNDEIDAIILALGKLTKAGQTYAGDINIRNLAELEIAETAFGIDPAVTDLDPMGMNITGSVLITAEATSLIATDAIKARLQVVMNSIKSAGVNLKVTGIDAASSLPALSFVGGNATFEGTSTLGLGALTSVIGTVHFDLAGAIVYPLLASAASVQISQASTVTSVDLSGLTSGNVFTTVNNLVLGNATSVKVAGIPPTVTCALATTFEDVSATAIGSVTETTITLPIATTVDLAATTISATIVANLANVTFSAATKISTSTFHVLGLDADSVTSIVNATISATTISLNTLASVPATLAVTGLATFSAPALATMTGNFTSDTVTNFDAPLLVTTGSIDLKDATPLTISIKTLGDTAAPANDIIEWNWTSLLTLGEQTGTVTFSGAVRLTTLTYTGKGAAAPAALGNDLVINSLMVSLTTIVLTENSEIEDFTVVSSTLTEITTDGIVLQIQALDNDLLTAINIGHTYKNGQAATIAQIVDNDILTTVDLSTLQKCKSFTITGNSSLTSFIPPGTDVLPSTTADIQINVRNNSLSGTYTAQVDGTDTTETVTHTATSVEGSLLKTYIDANIANMGDAYVSWRNGGAGTYIGVFFDVDRIDNATDTDGLFNNGKLSEAANNPTGEIDDLAEWALFD